MSRQSKRLSPKKAERMASLAWDAHSALQRTQMREPELAGNPYWQALKDAAYARMRAIFEHEAMK